MVDRLSKKQNNSFIATNSTPWTQDQYAYIIEKLISHGCQYVIGRNEYTLLREEVHKTTVTEVPKSSQLKTPKKPIFITFESTGVNSDICNALSSNDTSKGNGKMFLAPLDIQDVHNISDKIPSFKSLQSQYLRLNIGFDTEFQYFQKDDITKCRLLSLQMSINLGDSLIRYFFLVDPFYQNVDECGGRIPLNHCLSDILSDLKSNFQFALPTVRKEHLCYLEKTSKNGKIYKMLDFQKMCDSVIPISLICHTGKADISVFRRSKYDTDVMRKIAEIQGGWVTTENLKIKVNLDDNYNNYWLVDLNIRDTMALTPSDNKSLKSLGEVIARPKIELPDCIIRNMQAFALSNPIAFYEYAVNDSDIVVSFCSELFRSNHAVPMSLSSAASTSMYGSIKNYFGVKSKADFDYVYRGLELLDEGPLPSTEKRNKFLRATRYIPLSSNPDAKLINDYFEEAYTGGFNASFILGWITEKTVDLDMKNAYPTSMANIVDIDWSQPVRDFPRNYELSLQDLISPLIPCVGVGDFDFPEDCYCPNIPVPTKEGFKIYPRHGKNVYMSGPDMYLALCLGAKIKINRGFTCQMLIKDGKPSQCLAYAVSNLVRDRAKAKILYQDQPLIEKTLKTLVSACYGKTAQNVSPKTRYNAKKMGRVDAEPSIVTSPYHACYTTALVRCMLIACINQLHQFGYHVYSVTTDGFITNAPIDVVRHLDAYGFNQIFQNGRYVLNQRTDYCDDNQVWEAKHFNEELLNITTRGNVAINDDGVLAHNSYSTGEIKDSRADRDAFIVDVLQREDALICSTNVWTQFSKLVEKKEIFYVEDSTRKISMNFDYKRCPIVETAVDTAVHYESVDGCSSVDTTIALFDTRPYVDVEEFMNYRKTVKNEPCIKVSSDLTRVKVKSTMKTKGYIGKDLPRKVLLSILMGYRAGIYDIPILDGLKQSDIVRTVNSWNISTITVNDWKNCSRSSRQDNMLPRELIEDTLQKILSLSKK